MRERLLGAFVALTLLTVMLYAGPRAAIRADVVSEQAQREVDLTATVVAELIGTQLAGGRLAEDVALDFVPDGDQVTLSGPGGTAVLAGPPEQLDDPVVARRDVIVGHTVEVRRAGADVQRQVVDEIRPIVLTGLAALLASIITAVLLSARMARPFQRLAAQASSLGRGEYADLPPQRVREAEAIAEALRTSAARVEVVLQRERAFSRNASHQLRTPLTGMRLRVEDLSTWPEAPEPVRQELQEVLREIDRLADTVTALLAFTREERSVAWQETTLCDVVEETARRWGPLAAGSGRQVLPDAVPGPVLALPRVVLDQVLDVLVDNALKHGSGDVTVSAADGPTPTFEVRDEGTGLTDEAERQLFRRRAAASSEAGSEGIGLSLCADLLQALGGRLLLADRTPTTFRVVLPTEHPV
jgi:signal transduction histidine kinase